MPNILCSSCSAAFMSEDGISAITCGHLYHNACLTQWMERSKTCAHCPEQLDESKIVPAYFNIPEGATGLLLEIKRPNLEDERDAAMTRLMQSKEERDRKLTEKEDLMNKLTVTGSKLRSLKLEAHELRNVAAEEAEARKIHKSLVSEMAGEEYKKLAELLRKDPDEAPDPSEDPEKLKAEMLRLTSELRAENQTTRDLDEVVEIWKERKALLKEEMAIIRMNKADALRKNEGLKRKIAEMEEQLRQKEATAAQEIVEVDEAAAAEVGEKAQD